MRGGAPVRRLRHRAAGPRGPSHLAGWDRRGVAWLGAVVAALWLSGVVMHQWDPAELLLDGPAWQVALHRTATIVHGVGAWAACLLAGRWIWPHVPLVWRRRAETRTWWPGLLVLVVGAFVAIGGLVLLYGSMQWHEWMSPLHWWTGLAWPALLLLHPRWRLLRRGH